jgi:hypothetical protein
MLRKISLALVMMAVAGAFLLAPVNAQTSAKLVVVSGQKVFLGLDSPGNITCVGGELKAPLNPMDPCTSGTRRILIRNQTARVRYDIVAGPAELFGGTSAATLNYNLGPDLTGPVWGAFTWTVKSKFLGDPGETWEGVWFGQADLKTFVITFTVIGHGYGVRLDGLEFEIHAMFPGLPVPLGSGPFTGRVVGPGR